MCELFIWVGCATALFWPSPWGPGEGSKVNYHLWKVNFKDFYAKLFCLFSQIKEISLCRLGHTPGDGNWGCCRVKIYFFQTWSCGIPNWRGWWAKRDTSSIFTLWSNLWPWEGVNMSTIIKFLRKRGGAAPHWLHIYEYSHSLRCSKIRRLLFRLLI